MSHRNSACRQPGYVPLYLARNISGRSDSSVVPTGPLAAVLRREVSRLDSEFQHEINNVFGHRTIGQTLICERASAITGIGSETYYRRLYDILHGRSRTVGAHMADVLLMACDIHLEESDVPELPAGIEAARERVQVALDVQGHKLPKSVVNDLAEDLLEYTLTIVHDTVWAKDGHPVAEAVGAFLRHFAVTEEEQFYLPMAA